MNNSLIADIQYKTLTTEYNIHYHYNHEIIYVTDGKCEMTVNGKQYTAEKDDIILICNLENHRTRIIAEPYERYVLMINPAEFGKKVSISRLTAMFKQRTSDFRHCLTMSGTEIKALFEKLEYEKNCGRAFSDELSLMYLKEILIAIIRKHESNFQKELNKTQEIILKAQSYIENNFASDIKIDELSDMFFINKYYFSHCFKDFSGISPKQYLTQVRLNNALKLLDNTELSISEITEQCGFSDINNFIRLFKAEFGNSPLKYRNRRTK